MEAKGVLERYMCDVDVSCVSDRCWQVYQRCEKAVNRVQFPFLIKEGKLCIENVNSFGGDVDTLVGQLLHEVDVSHPTVSDARHTLTFCKCLRETTTTEVLLFQLIAKDDSSPVLLKEVLCSSLLEDILTQPVVQLLRHLLLPAGLNFRNIIWHGFLAPHEVDIRYLYLFEVLNRTLREKIPSRVFYRCYDFRSFDFCELSLQSLQDSIANITSSDLANMLDSCTIVPRNRQDMLMFGLSCYHERDYIACMLSIIPCLEHTLRYLFCIANHTPELLTANVDAYYSTLDGFGQRSKHQLLLDTSVYNYSHMRSSSDPAILVGNSVLPSMLGSGLYAILIDMFFTDRGPNIRSALAHGEVTMLYGGDQSFAASPAVLVLATTIALCQRFQEGSEPAIELNRYKSLDMNLEVPATIPGHSSPLAVEQCCQVIDNWVSYYHPHTYLARQIDDFFASIATIVENLQCRRNMCTAASRNTSSTVELMLRITLPCGDTIDIWEKESKLCDYSLDFCNAISVKMSKPKASHVYATSIISRCEELIRTLLHSVRSTSSSLLLSHLLSVCTIGTSIHQNTDDFKKSYLNIDEPLLPVYNCCVQVIKVGIDMLQVTQELIRQNERLIQNKTAHTSDRRRYLLLLLVLAPVIVAVASLSLCVVVRHVELANDATTGILQAVLNMNASFQVCIQNVDDGRTIDQNKKKSPEKALVQLLTTLESKQFSKGIRGLC